VRTGSSSACPRCKTRTHTVDHVVTSAAAVHTKGSVRPRKVKPVCADRAMTSAAAVHTKGSMCTRKALPFSFQARRDSPALHPGAASRPYRAP
jgi:hypothetical protein